MTVSLGPAFAVGGWFGVGAFSEAVMYCRPSHAGYDVPVQDGYYTHR